jgi:hypothetical protein
MIDIQKLPDDVLNGVFKKRYKEVDNNDKFNIFKKKLIKYFETLNLVDIESNIKNYFKSIEDYYNTNEFNEENIDKCNIKNIEYYNMINNSYYEDFEVGFEDDEENTNIDIEEFKHQIKLKKCDIDYHYWEKMNLSHIINLDNYDSYNTYVKGLKEFNNLRDEFDGIRDDIGIYLSSIKEFDKNSNHKYNFDLLEILKNYILNYNGVLKFSNPDYVNGIDDEIDNKVYSFIQNTDSYCLFIIILTEHYFNIYNKIKGIFR